MLEQGSSSDFDLVGKKSIAKYKELGLTQKFQEKVEYERIGFYFLALEIILGIRDPIEIKNLIIDESYQQKINDVKGNKDYGIDAVHIDYESDKVSLFNFKYRKNFQSGSTQTPSELKNSEAFLGYMTNKELFEKDKESMGEKTRDYLEQLIEIKDKIEYSDFEYELFLVTNDNKKIDAEDPAITTFKENYPWLKISNINLADFSKYLSIKPLRNTAMVIIDNKELLQHDMGYTTANSYVVRLKLKDLMKVTSTNLDVRTEKSLEEAEVIQGLNIDLNVLFDNVRGYLGDTEYNNNIISTLENEPEKFFLYNNGVTITADDIVVEKVDISERHKVTLKDYQIVNGGQTLRSIYKFKEKNPDLTKNLAKASVLVRIFKTGLESGLVNKVAEYTNSQNSISPTDLRSVDSIQLDIENHFEEEKIKYIRKRSAEPFDGHSYDFSISMEKMGQLLLSKMGFPEKSSNNKKKIFSKYYERIFNMRDGFIEEAREVAKLYKDIYDEYDKNKNYEYYDQKVFYIIYVKYIDTSLEIGDIIKLLEECIEEYRDKDDITPSRKLLQKGFKELLDDKLKERDIQVPDLKPLK